MEDLNSRINSKNLSIRHFKELIIRNLTGKDEKSLFSSYFTIQLHLKYQSRLLPKTTEGDVVVYQSEVSPNTINPSWKLITMDLQNESESCDCFTLSVLEKEKVLFQVEVHMKELKFLGNYRPKFLANLKTPLAFPENTLFFCLSDGYYTLPRLYDFLHTQIPASLLQPSPNEEVLINPKELIEGIVAFEKNKKQLLDLKRMKASLMKQYNEKTREVNEKFVASNEIHYLTERLAHYQQDKDRETLLCKKEMDANRECEEQISTITDYIQTSIQTITDRYSHLSDYKTKIQGEKEKYGQMCNFLEARRLKILHHLRLLYPIKKVGTDFTIRDLVLNEKDGILNSLEFAASALGFTVHYVLMLAKYLEIPLKYELVFEGCESYASDSTKNDDLSYVFNPLRGNPRTFNYAIFMLRRNIEQILYNQNLQLIKDEPLLSCLLRLEKKLLYIQ